MADVPRVITSRPAEEDLFSELESRRARRQAIAVQYTDARRTYGAAADQVAAQIAEARRKAPWIPASTLVALVTKAGLDPADPRFAEIAVAAAKAKGKSGLGWHSVGDVVKAAGGVAARGVDRALLGADEAAARLVKPVVRGAAVAAQSGYEEAQGALRNVAAYKPGGLPVGAAVAGGVTAAALAASAPISLTGAATAGVVAGAAALGAAGGTKIEGQGRWEPQSSGAIALGRMLRGERVDFGSGYMPNGNAGPASAQSIAEEQLQRARRVSIDGHSLTPGRLLTAGVLEPGTKPANILSGLIDGSLALSRFDPASAGTKALGNVNRNRKLFIEAGELFTSGRPGIDLARAESWWTGATGVRKWLTDSTGEHGFLDIWERTKGKLGADTTKALADASTDAEVDAIIRPLLGVDNALRGPLDAAGFNTKGVERSVNWARPDTYGLFEPLQNVRLLKTMPGHTIDLLDKDHSVHTIQTFLENAKVGRDVIAKHTAAMAAADGRMGRLAVTKVAMDAVKDSLVADGWGKGVAGKMTRLVDDATEDTRHYFVNAAGEDVRVPGVWTGDQSAIAKPHLFTEFVNRALPLPNARDIRAATSAYGPLLKNDGLHAAYKLGTSALDFIQGKVWKRSALMRFAYTTRVVGEEQLRMAASGLESMINHPLSLISMRLSDTAVHGGVPRTIVGRAIQGTERGVAKAASKAGLELDKGAVDILGSRFRQTTEEEFVDHLDAFSQSQNKGWAGWTDPISMKKHWRRFRPGDDGFERAWASEITKLGNDPVAREVARGLDDIGAVKTQFWGAGATRTDDAATGLERYRTLMGEEASGLLTREVSDAYVDSIVDRIRQTTGNDTTLIDALRTSTLGDVPLRTGVKPSKELLDHLAANPDIAPAWVAGEAAAEHGVAHALDQATSYLFSNLMAERTNNLSRSPTFKQFYWQRAEELAPYMTDEARARMVVQARAAKLGDVADRMTGVIGNGADLDLENADIVAKGFALDSTKDLLYDMSEKGQFFDAARLIFPFGEAWKELVGRWAKIGLDRPQVARRAQQVISGARGADLNGDGQGFFYKDTRGQERFAYPASGWISDKLIGVPIPLTGRVAGLSLMTEVMPGVGPVAQMAAGALVPNKPEFDKVHSLLFPFGESDTSHGIVESFAPAWLKRFAGGFSTFARDDKAWNGTVMDTARYLASTGRYDTSTPEGISKLIADASDKAGSVWMLRGMAQFVSPTAPSPEWIAADPSGNNLVTEKLSQEYRKLIDDPETRDQATSIMLDRYGEGISLVLQGKTAEVTPGAPVGKAGGDWERTHPDMVKAHPTVWGMFAPSGGDIDFEVYNRRLASGDRVNLRPEVAVKLANARVAQMKYQQAKDRVGPKPNAAETAWLRQLREALAQDYPGFGDRSGVPEKASLATLVRDLTSASSDPRLASSPAMSALRKYLAGRQKASDAAQAAGLSPTGFLKSKSQARTRAWLRRLGSTLVAENPAFAPMWERVFDAELADDTFVGATTEV